MRLNFSTWLSISVVSLLAMGLPGQSVDPGADRPAQRGDRDSQGGNPYSLEPFRRDFPVELEYPTRRGLEYDRTRRQVVERIVANLQGGGRRETWMTAVDYFWGASEEMVEPLISAMDRNFGDPSMNDMVRNCVEAMGRMQNPAFDDALQRAIEHRSKSVRNAAFAALARSSSDETLRGMFPLFAAMDGHGRKAWLQQARERLGREAVPMFTELMGANYPPFVKDEVLLEALKLPPRQAVEVVRGLWDQAVGEFKAVIAGAMHAAGDTVGTAWLRDTLRGEDLRMLPFAVRYSTTGPIDDLRDSLLALSSHPRAEIRLELAKALVHVEADGVADVYEILSQPDEAWQTKSIALRELTRRGRATAASALLEEVETAKGTRLRVVLNMLGATADPRAVPVFVTRFESAPAGEGRPFLQALSVLGCESAAEALIEIFLDEEVLVERGRGAHTLTTHSYIPLLLMNLRGCEEVVFAAFEDLGPERWRHRSRLMSTVIGMAADRNDPELVRRAAGSLKRILFAREELPQLRVQALNLLTRRHIRVDDVMRLKNGLYDEKRGMRALLCDFLHDFF